MSVLCHFRLLNSFELHSNRSSPQFFGNRSGNNLSSIKVFFYFCPTAVATASRTILHQKINYDLEREKDYDEGTYDVKAEIGTVSQSGDEKNTLELVYESN